MSGRIDPELLELLVCPRCGAPDLEVRSGADGSEEALECRACGVAYSVDDGIPVMLVEEATPLASGYVKDPPRWT